MSFFMCLGVLEYAHFIAVVENANDRGVFCGNYGNVLQQFIGTCFLGNVNALGLCFQHNRDLTFVPGKIPTVRLIALALESKLIKGRYLPNALHNIFLTVIKAECLFRMTAYLIFCLCHFSFSLADLSTENVIYATFLMRSISPASILVKPKHFLPRSFSDAPIR